MSAPTTFGSVCSGIEAASVAWHPLGWRAAWLAEIEPFPSTVLAHHYPGVPNLGDMTKIAVMVRDAVIPAPDVFCGGTPCQAFSVAGLRNSLGDARGNLSLTFCEIADEIDIRRAATGLLPAIMFWENVPGVLSTNDNAFGCFLAGLAGEDDPLVAPGGKWANAGCVFGPQRTVAWRTLDAQYFGVAQRRRRVFVVASAREGFDPCEVLFEFDGMRRDTAPRRETGQDVTGTVGARTTGGGGFSTDFECAGGLQPVAYAPEIARCVATREGSSRDYETTTMLAVQALSVALRGRDGGATAELGGPVAGTLRASGGGGDKAHVLAPIAFDSRQDCVSSTSVFGALGSSSPQAQAVSYAIQAAALRTNPNSGPDGVGVQADIAYTLEARAEVQVVGYSCKDCGADATVELAPTMRAMGHQGSHANAGDQLAVYITGDITHTLKGEGFDASEDGTGRGQPIVATVAVSPTLRAGGNKTGGDLPPGTDVDTADSLLTNGMAIRRLTPRECARLQGFPDDYLAQVIVRGKPAADGPMYKAFGNSWAVPNVAWIGRRIDREIKSAAGAAA